MKTFTICKRMYTDNMCFKILLVFCALTAVFGASVPGGLVELNCTNPNEHYSCGSACQNECNFLGEYCPIANFRCNDDCYCNDGYARNKQGVCIPEKDCPAKDPNDRCRYKIGCDF